MKPKNRSDRVDEIYRVLQNAILEQELEAGRKLPEDSIGETFGVSRTIVRYALNQLAVDGLVVQRRNRSATVAQPSWEDAQDTFEIRIALERLVMSRLSGEITDEQVETLRDHVRLEAAAQNKNEVQSIRLASEFHIKLAEMTESELLIRSVREFSLRCTLILAMYSRPHSSECGVDEHAEIVDLLSRREGAKAAMAMTAHLQAVADRALVAPQRKKSRDITDILSRYAEEDGSTED